MYVIILTSSGSSSYDFMLTTLTIIIIHSKVFKLIKDTGHTTHAISGKLCC